MSDIFISYSRNDKDRAEKLAGAFERRGFSVWWDRKIPPGRTFDEVIQEALTRASCVVVLWSRASVQSDFVKDEAQRAADKDRLIPVLIDDVPIPLGFGRIQTANLVGWREEEFHPQFEYVVESIAVFAGRPLLPGERTGFRVLPPLGPPPVGRPDRPLAVAPPMPEPGPIQPGPIAPVPAVLPGSSAWRTAFLATLGVLVLAGGTFTAFVSGAIPIHDRTTHVAEQVADVPPDPVTEAIPETPIAVPEPEQTVTVPEPESPVTVPEPETPVIVPEPETPVTVPEPEVAVAVLEPETPEPEALTPEPEPKPEEHTSDFAVIASAEDFVTCDRVRKLTPVGVGSRFQPGKVYVFARIRSPRSEELTFEWLQGGEVTRVQSVRVSPNLAGYRVFDVHAFREPGTNEVRLYNSRRELIGTRTFEVRPIGS